MEDKDITEGGKYYQPDITEFRVGFEYQFKLLINGNWTNKIFKEANDLVYISDVLKNSLDGFIRTKRLDREDIEAEGWVAGTTNIYDINKVGFGLNGKSDYVLVFDEPNICNIYHNGTELIFKGTIRNRTEIRDLMRMLNIKKENDGK